MTRRAFFSFHYQQDIWRVNQVRNSWIIQPGSQKAVWYDASLWEATKKKGVAALMNLIDDGLTNTSVTVVLIGSQTYQRRWVKYEIQESHRRKKGLLGIHIHSLKNEEGETDTKGQNPFDCVYVKGTNPEVCLSQFKYPVYWWGADDGYNNICSWIEAAAKQAGR